MAADLKCPICGQPTRIYMGHARKDGLCGTHADMLKAGKLFKVEENGETVFYTDSDFSGFEELTKLPTSGFDSCVSCGKKTTGHAFCKDCWSNNEDDALLSELNSHLRLEFIKQKKNTPVEPTPTEKNSVKETDETHCVVCGQPSYGKKQCKSCFYETQDFIETLDRNSNIRKTRDHYYNLKERIFIIKTLEETQKQCNRLIAIATVANTYHNDSSLIDKVYKDVETLIKGKQAPKPDDKFEEERKEKDESKTKVNTAQDGHNVDSDMEVRIDDVLYNSCILHAYGVSIPEITEKRKKCDWFIPIRNDEGIYIEYWGMKTPKYLEERKEKEELYQKHNIPYIGIEADEPRKDTSTFKTNLLRDLRKMAEEYYGFMPKWH